MRKVLVMLLAGMLLSGCYEKTPSKDKAVEIAKQEISMALCGDRTGGCIVDSVGTAHISDRFEDHTNKIVVNFSGIIQRADAPHILQKISGGEVSYIFDAKDGKSYIKEISLWSLDGTHSIELCGHDYMFCRE